MRMIDLQVIRMGEANNILDMVLSLLEVLKEHDQKMSLISIEASTTLVDSSPVNRVILRLQILELFRERMPNVFEYFGKKDPIPDELLREAGEVFLECAGGVKNGRIKGLGNLSSEYTSGSVSHTMPNEVLTQQVSQLSEENSRLREDLSAVRESLAEERERATAAQSAMQAEIARIAQLVQGFLHTPGSA